MHNAHGAGGGVVGDGGKGVKTVFVVDRDRFRPRLAVVGRESRVHAGIYAIRWRIVWWRRGCVYVGASVIDQKGREAAVGLETVCMLGVGKADWGNTGGCIEVHSVYSRNGDGCSAHRRFGRSSRCTGDKIYRLSYALCVLHVGDCD